MTPNDFQFGFSIIGKCHNERRLVNANGAFVAYCECDPRAVLNRECYLSAFQFNDVLATQIQETGSTKDYYGPTWSAWLWFDIDCKTIDTATNDARRLVTLLVERFGIAGDELLIFYSGSKGYHVGLPTSLWNPLPSNDFHSHCRLFALSLAAIAGVAIDRGVYDRVRPFRAPNSMHPKTSRHKRFLGLDELMGLRPTRIIELAAEPLPIELPSSPKPCRLAIQDWRAAVDSVQAQQSTTSAIATKGARFGTVNRSTMDFIREGANQGDRHRSLFSAAANLAEFGCGYELAWAILSESALDSGLSPSDVRRQIECGLKHGGTK